jgi:transposase/IS5 family transposase
MGKTFRAYDMNQQMLLPPDLREWLRADHLALFVSDVVESLDLSGILKVYEEGDGRGRPPYHPAMMVKLLVYGYCTGKTSSRKLEQATYEDVAFRVLSCNQQPDHDSIAGFRQRHLQELGRLFVQVLQLFERAGLVKLGHVAVDGTKIKANASKYQSLSYENMKNEEQQLAREVARLLGEAQQIDDEEDKLYGKGKRGDELPEELRDRKRRLAKIRALKAELEEEAKTAAAKSQAEKEKPTPNSARKWRRKWEVTEQGEILPMPKTKRNLTDPDSRIMKDGATKAFHQAYNIQVGVDEQAQIIVGTKVVQSGADQEQLIPLLHEVEKNLGRMPERVSADAGYYSKAAITHEAVRAVDLYVPPNQRRPVTWEETLTSEATLQERMWHKLGTKEGRKVFGKRKVIVEPIFAHIKHIRGFRQFLLRGLQQVEAEWLLVCMTHNLLKMFRATNQAKTA